MSVTLWVSHEDRSVKRQRRGSALRVIEYFGDAIPRRRVKVLLDRTEWDFLKAEGPENRGAFLLVNDHYFDKVDWTPQLFEQLVTATPKKARREYRCSAAVYLHNSTCQRVDGLTMTLAHELQHVVQYYRAQKVWAYNKVVMNLKRTTIAAHMLTWHDIPIEREARIVAKRASESILGTTATEAYVDFRTASGSVLRDIADWRAIRDIPASPEREYDCAHETRRLFHRLRPIRAELEASLTELRGDPEFARLDLRDIFETE